MEQFWWNEVSMWNIQYLIHLYQMMYCWSFCASIAQRNIVFLCSYWTSATHFMNLAWIWHVNERSAITNQMSVEPKIIIKYPFPKLWQLKNTLLRYFGSCILRREQELEEKVTALLRQGRLLPTVMIKYNNKQVQIQIPIHKQTNTNTNTQTNTNTN